MSYARESVLYQEKLLALHHVEAVVVAVVTEGHSSSSLRPCVVTRLVSKRPVDASVDRIPLEELPLRCRRVDVMVAAVES